VVVPERWFLRPTEGLIDCRSAVERDGEDVVVERARVDCSRRWSVCQASQLSSKTPSFSDGVFQAGFV
jgi:hypothetical protein